MNEERKRVRFTYDSELKTVKATWSTNLAIINDNKCKFQEPDLNVLEGDKIQLQAAKECLEEMLKLVNEAIANC